MQRALRDCFGFDLAALVCFAAAERVQPQPGRFHAGWMTAEIVGPCTGETGSEGC